MYDYVIVCLQKFSILVKLTLRPSTLTFLLPMPDRCQEIIALLENNPPLTSLVKIDFVAIRKAMARIASARTIKSFFWRGPSSPRFGTPDIMLDMMVPQQDDHASCVAACYLLPPSPAIDWFSISSSAGSPSASAVDRYSLVFTPSSGHHPGYWFIRLRKECNQGSSEPDEENASGGDDSLTGI